MKKLYLIGNHKMNLNKIELCEYLKKLAKAGKKSKNQIGVALSSPYLYLAEKYLKKTHIYYGAQNCHYATKGAYTGENSVKMLKDFGCNICIVGHSERVINDNETNEKINLKIKALLKDSVKPIFCMGETLEEKKNGLTKKSLKIQLEEGLKDLNRDEIKKIYFAYEPVWAIGTGQTATPKQIEEIARFIKDYLCKQYDITEGEIILLYGGSLKPENAVEILSKTHIDGGLIGGASLHVDTFSQLFDIEIDDIEN